MAIRSVSRSGNDLIVFMDDGTRCYCYKSIAGTWVSTPEEKNKPNEPGAGGDTPADGDGVGTVTQEMVDAAIKSAGGSPANALFPTKQIADAFTNMIGKYGQGNFKSKAARACLVGECAQETDWYKTAEEYGGPSTSYAPYYGRGFIQLTHKGNYQEFQQWLQRIGYGTFDLVGNPGLVSSNVEMCCLAAIFYFTQRKWANENLCQWCAKSPGIKTGKWTEISKAINRGNPWAGSPAYGDAARDKAINAAMAVTPEPAAAGSGIAGKAVAWMLAHTGKFYYSQDGWVRTHMNESGGGDCSGCVITAYLESGATVKQMGGFGYTGTLAKAGKLVNNTGNEKDMKPGDIILINWSGPNPTFDHAVMYIGNGKVSSHGGPGKGPVTQNLSGNVPPASYNVQVRRYV